MGWDWRGGLRPAQTHTLQLWVNPGEGWDIPAFTRTEAARGWACLGGAGPRSGSHGGQGTGSGSELPVAHRLQKGKACPDGDKCRCAHGQEELNEWLDRREVLKQKLAKARKDMLLCPRDDDFGKYNFLLQEDGNTAGAAPEAPAAATVSGE